jgi:hypothetical protein
MFWVPKVIVDLVAHQQQDHKRHDVDAAPSLEEMGSLIIASM